MEYFLLGVDYLKNLFSNHDYQNHLSDINKKQFAIRVKNARINAGLTLTQLSEMTGISLSLMEDIERGTDANISEETLLTLAFFLKRSPSYLCSCSETKWDFFDLPLYEASDSLLVANCDGTITEEEYQNKKLIVFGTRIRLQREKKQFKLADISKKIGVSQAEISNLEKGKTLRPKFRKVMLLSYALSCTTDYICGLSSAPTLQREELTNPFIFFDRQTTHDLAGMEAMLNFDPDLCRALVACLRLSPKKRYVIRAMIDTYLETVQNDEW